MAATYVARRPDHGLSASGDPFVHRESIEAGPSRPHSRRVAERWSDDDVRDEAYGSDDDDGDYDPMIDEATNLSTPNPTIVGKQSSPSLLKSPAKSPSSRQRSATRSLPPSRTEKNYKCQFEGCGKAYTKPARLKEHELSHTGERPHVCPYCHQTYIRPTHLTAHLRTHLSEDDKKFKCTEPGCDKRFWTATHLKRHEAFHRDAFVYACPHCDERFHKSKSLRDHITLAHMPAGTKPYTCTHEGCTASFAIQHQLKAHVKTHDTSRYACTDPSHPSPVRFPTWSALQKHVHDQHPPTCPEPSCGKVFKHTYRLREHLRCHALRVDALGVVVDAGGEVVEGKKKRKRRGSGAGRANGVVLGVEKRAKSEQGQSGSSIKKMAMEDTKDGFSLDANVNSEPVVDIIFGPTTAARDENQQYYCPVRLFSQSSEVNQVQRRHASSVEPLPIESNTIDAPKPREGGDEQEPLQSHADRCFARFWRVYDVMRHLKVAHGVEMSEGELRDLLGAKG